MDLIGGYLDGMILTRDTFNVVRSMPNLTAQRQMLVRLLEQPARSITEVLERSQGSLVAMLGQHQDILVSKTEIKAE